MSRDQVAEHLGIKPESVRTTMHRAGIPEERGYRREKVMAMRRRGRGFRSDLHKT